ncbi:MAG: response regulator [Verrucomicrobiota bacterium]|nr:response regulator [Verrucomicrobiota bacterium]
MLPTSHLSQADASAKRILVVDDQAAVLQMLAHFLKADGHRVICAVDGFEGLHTAQTQPVDLVLLDLDMPGMGGFEVCAKLKKGLSTAHIPVLLISARLTVHDWPEIVAAGADGFLPKPFSFEQMRGEVRRLLSLAAR